MRQSARLAVAVAVAVVVVAAVGCARPEPRFADRALLWRDPDDAPVPMPPAHIEPGNGRLWFGAENAIFRPADRLFSADYGLEALNVNALDEVPDSSWYSDPRRDPTDPSGLPLPLSAAELERGLVVDEPPRPPFRIVRALEGGSSDGFVVDDALGRRYALKLDPEEHLGLVTGADVVATRLAWASGWRVPAEEIVDVTRSELQPQPGATMTNEWGQHEPLGDGDVDAILWHAARTDGGRYRAVASRWVPGRALGPFSWLGRNRADANDRYAHENRRDLRGFGVWASWVDDIDVIENNTLDSYVGSPGRGHVVHYQLDVGGSFGSFSAAPAHYWMGEQAYFQLDRILGSIVTFGVVPYRWENRRWQQRRERLVREYPELGGYSGEHFDPLAWHPIIDIPPFVRQTRRDRYWGAKRVAAFATDELRGAIAAARYRPAAAEYLLQALQQRRERIARDAFSAVAPLDHFRIDGERLCFTDWWVHAGLGGGGATDYRAREAERVVDVRHGSDSAGSACVALPRRDGYRVIELAALRPGERHFGPQVRVHLLAGIGATRVLGVIR
ncbi:MAG: hypothetical protein JWM53_5770 [bacterium]|nr:hypothetical protein [bacterium]